MRLSGFLQWSVLLGALGLLLRHDTLEIPLVLVAHVQWFEETIPDVLYYWDISFRLVLLSLLGELRVAIGDVVFFFLLRDYTLDALDAPCAVSAVRL